MAEVGYLLAREAGPRVESLFLQSLADGAFSAVELIASYLRFPAEHHKRIRHSNFIERTFGETRRRVKVIGRLPGETSCLNLVWAVLNRASRGWRGLTTTSHSTRQLQDLRRQLLDPPTPIKRHQPAAASAAPETVGAVA